MRTYTCTSTRLALRLLLTVLTYTAAAAVFAHAATSIVLANAAAAALSAHAPHAAMQANVGAFSSLLRIFRACGSFSGRVKLSFEGDSGGGGE
jgi:hypothetical protein